MKVIKICSCLKCPYHTFEMPDVFIAGGFYCGKMKNKRICAFHDKYIKNFIPEWCPLENIDIY